MNLSETPPPLTRLQRQRLFDALEQIAVFDSLEGRNLLLIDLPSALQTTLLRNSSKILDLNEIIDKALRWQHLEKHTPAIYIVIENAFIPSRGSAAGLALRELYQELTGPSLALSPAIPDSPLVALPSIPTP